MSALTGAGGVNLTEVLLRAWQVPVLGIVVVANVTGGVFLLATAALRGDARWRRWPAADWVRLAAASASAFGLAFVLLYHAVDLAGASTTVMLGRLEALFVVALAVICLGERWSLYHWGATLMAVAGTVLVTLDPEALELGFGMGEALALAAALVSAAGIVILKTLVDRQDSRVVTGAGLLLGAVLVAPFAGADSLAAVTGSGPWVAWILVLRGLLLGLSWVTYNVAMRHLGAARAAVGFLSVVVFTALLQVGVDTLAPGLGVHLPASWPAALAGGLLIGLAVALIHRQG